MLLPPHLRSIYNLKRKQDSCKAVGRQYCIHAFNFDEITADGQRKFKLHKNLLSCKRNWL